jgi:hypothetical protein
LEKKTMNENEKAVLADWLDYTRDSIAALQVWLGHLREWERNSCRERGEGDFWAAFRNLCDTVYDGWADQSYADIDHLHGVVTGEGLPEPVKAGPDDF